ncbi:hypothetical protein PF001_g30697 [Phytophthora fragariae]|uniref:Secreted protein n=1 Tax=Phytophthora fragariae TaxID=53985 RepID=A0A6A4AY89_9STRA|nr:hypothetical protein PF001_g30697 [Phytophthora fragariae]
MFLRPRLSAFSFCLSTASCSASRTKRAIDCRCMTNSETAAFSTGRAGVFAAYFAASGTSALPGLINVRAVHVAMGDAAMSGVARAFSVLERVTAFSVTSS